MRSRYHAEQTRSGKQRTMESSAACLHPRVVHSVLTMLTPSSTCTMSIKHREVEDLSRVPRSPQGFIYQTPQTYLRTLASLSGRKITPPLTSLFWRDLVFLKHNSRVSRRVPVPDRRLHRLHQLHGDIVRSRASSSSLGWSCSEAFSLVSERGRPAMVVSS